MGKHKIMYVIAVVAACLLFEAVRVLADVGIPSPTILLGRFSPSSGTEMKEMTRQSLVNLAATADETIAYLGGVVLINDGSRLHSVWNGTTNSLYIVSPDGAYTNLIMTTVGE